MDSDRHWPHLWLAYCEAFPEAAPALLRPHCHPRCLLHKGGAGRALVLVHGLTDSPALLADLADHFHHRLGYDVYLPLLHGHGLQAPQGMRRVRLEQWLDNVRFAVACASRQSTSVALGGLSTGGALSLYLAACGERPRADLYLFSPALGLAPGPAGIPGRWAERLLERPWVVAIDRILDRFRPLVGRHPYRYDRVPLVSAAQLVRLMRMIDRLYPVLPTTLQGTVFAAWSESDQVVSVAKIAALTGRLAQKRVFAFVLPQAAGVPHASVVLHRSIRAVDGEGEVLEAANPRFTEMLAEIDLVSPSPGDGVNGPE
jgi:alpha-beta hydrolase superfamily lysophospholipase